MQPNGGRKQAESDLWFGHKCSCRSAAGGARVDPQDDNGFTLPCGLVTCHALSGGSPLLSGPCRPQAVTVLSCPLCLRGPLSCRAPAAEELLLHNQ